MKEDNLSPSEKMKKKMEQRYEKQREFILEGNRNIGDYLGLRYTSDQDGNGKLYRFPDGSMQAASTLEFHKKPELQQMIIHKAFENRTKLEIVNKGDYFYVNVGGKTYEDESFEFALFGAASAYAATLVVRSEVLS